MVWVFGPEEGLDDVHLEQRGIKKVRRVMQEYEVEEKKICV